MKYKRKYKKRNVNYKSFEVEIRTIFSYYLEDICMRDDIAIRTLIIRMRKATNIEINMRYVQNLKHPTWISQITVSTLANFAYAAGGSFDDFCRYYINYKKANRELENENL